MRSNASGDDCPGIPTLYEGTKILIRSEKVPIKIKVAATVGPRILLRKGFHISIPKAGIRKLRKKVPKKNNL